MSVHSINWSRRQLLKAGGVGLAAVSLGSLLKTASVVAADGDNDYGGLPMGLQTYSLRSMAFGKAMETISGELKLREIELYAGHLGWTAPPPKIKEAQARLKELGLTPVSIGAVGVDKNETKARELFEFAKAMGMKNISISPSPDAFDLLDKLTEEYKITASIHDHGPEDKKWGKIAQIEEGIKNHSKMIGLCNDTGHFIRAGEDPLDACHRLKDRMYAIHLKDFKKTEAGKWEDCVLGDGGLKVDEIVKFLIDNKYRGVLAIEYEGGDPVNSIQKSLARLRDAAKKAKA